MKETIRLSVKLSVALSEVMEHVSGLSGIVDAEYISDMLFPLNQAINPVAVYTVCDRITFHNAAFCMGGYAFECGRTIVSQLQGSCKIAAIVCTLGQSIEEVFVRCKANGDKLAVYICDIAANIAVEKLVAIVKKHLYEHEALPYSWKMGNDFSPGDGEWDISEQSKLLSLFSEGTCPVSLTPYCLMKPLKSLSFVIGIGPDLHCASDKCQFCTLVHCSYKKQVRWK